MGRRGTSFVVLGSPAGPHDYPAISGDNVRGGYLAAAHLLAQGRRRITFVGGPHRDVAARREGARRAAAECPEQVAFEFLPVPQQTAEAGESVARRFLARPRAELPDGILAGNDVLALALPGAEPPAPA